MRCGGRAGRRAADVVEAIFTTVTNTIRLGRDGLDKLAIMHSVSLAALLLVLVLSAACGGRKPTPKKLPPPMPAVIGATQRGVASWYGHPYHGRHTSNGEVYDMNKMTAAHLALPFDTWLQVTNRDNGRSTQVRVNDRGPFVKNRIIDLSRAAAEAIAMIGPGTARVRLKIIKAPDSGSAARKSGARGSVVQIGSFRHLGKAESVAADAKLLGYKVDLQKAQTNKGVVFRVLVKPPKGGSAEAALDRLQREGFQGFVRKAP